MRTSWNNVVNAIEPLIHVLANGCTWIELYDNKKWIANSDDEDIELN